MRGYHVERRVTESRVLFLISSSRLIQGLLPQRNEVNNKKTANHTTNEIRTNNRKMGQYKANSLSLRSFSLTNNNKMVGELVYPKWYSFKADIIINDKTNYKFATKGRWKSKLVLQQDDKTLAELKMTWKGVVIKTKFDNKEQNYLLKAKTFLNRKYVLIDTDKNELVLADTDFQWKKLRCDYDITTTDEFEKLDNKEVLLFVILHGINYYQTIVAGAA